MTNGNRIIVGANFRSDVCRTHRTSDRAGRLSLDCDASDLEIQFPTEPLGFRGNSDAVLRCHGGAVETMILDFSGDGATLVGERAILVPHAFDDAARQFERVSSLAVGASATVVTVGRPEPGNRAHAGMASTTASSQ